MSTTLLKPLGYQVLGVDLSKVLASVSSNTVRAQVETMLMEHSLLVFPAQHNLSATDQCELAGWFGTGRIFELPPRYQHPQSPKPSQVLRVSNSEAEGFKGVGTEGWHIDGVTYKKVFSHSLYQIVHPAGSTHFFSLSTLADKLTADSPKWDRLWVACGGRSGDTVIHPLLYTHPRTATTVVCLSLSKIKYFVWDHESDAPMQTDPQSTRSLMQELEEHIAEMEDLVYRHEWQHGDLLITDNQAVAHWAPPETQADPQSVGLRVLHRIVIDGGVVSKRDPQICADEKSLL